MAILRKEFSAGNASTLTSLSTFLRSDFIKEKFVGHCNHFQLSKSTISFQEMLKRRCSQIKQGQITEVLIVLTEA